jgi:hypothetical protein
MNIESSPDFEVLGWALRPSELRAIWARKCEAQKEEAIAKLRAQLAERGVPPHDREAFLEDVAALHDLVAQEGFARLDYLAATSMPDARQ